MKRLMPITLVALCLFAMGCSDTAAPPIAGNPSDVTMTSYADASLCGACGQIKGSETCCADGAEKCEKCTLVAGSPGCCKMAAGADVALCTKCGQIDGDATCCAEDAEKCAECGLTKDSPGCCRLEKE